MDLTGNIDKTFSAREAALRFLDGRINYERARNVPYRARELKLDRMRELLARLGDPHDRLTVVHVAGTKGKGSTTAMIGAMLTAAGYRTGVFTSPHLDRIEQRIALDDRPCTSGELIELVDAIRPAVEAMDREAGRHGADDIGPTYFEIATAMAFLHFARREVAAAVLEVGLGGRLDSTNVCRPTVSVITSISFDHVRQLGNTLEAIAWEKAGIVKPGVPVVSGVTNPGPRDVIREVCRRRGCRLVELGEHFDYTYRPPVGLESAAAFGNLDFGYGMTPGATAGLSSSACGESLGNTAGQASSGTPSQRAAGPSGYDNLPLGLLGHHQAANAAIALAALGELERLGWDVPEPAIRTGLAEVVWPARIELVARRPAVIVDTAHNGASIDALLRVLDESFTTRRRLLIFGATCDKDIRGMIGRLLDRFDEVVFTRYLENPRAVPPEELAAMAAEITDRSYSVQPTPANAWAYVRRRAAPEDLICVTGSLFLAAETRRLIVGQ